MYLNTSSGLSAPGGFIDRLTQAMDVSAQNDAQLRGLAAGGVIPQSAAPGPGLFSRMFGLNYDGSPVAQSVSSPPVAYAPPMPAIAPAQAASGGSGSALPIFRNAIASIESNGSGDYKAQGPMTDTGDRGLGRYQVMASNVGPWSKEILGLSQGLTRKQFLDNPDLQDAIFDGKFLQYLRQTGNPRDAASMWFTGKPYAQGADRQDQLGTTGAGYVAKFMAALPRGPASANAPQAIDASVNDPAPQGEDGVSNKMPHALAYTGPENAPAQASPAMQPQVQPQQPVPAAVPAGTLGAGAVLPNGAQIEALIANPATRQLGLQLWQTALTPQPGFTLKPGEQRFDVRGREIAAVSNAPVSVAPGNMLVDPRSGGTIAAAPPDLQHAEIGRDAYGQPTYGAFDPRRGAVAPFPNASGSGPSGTATSQDGQPLTGAAFLNTLPPSLAGQVKAVADGRIKLPTGMGAGNPMAQRLRAAVLQYDPSFDQAGVDARFETRADFAKGDAAKVLTAGNTALIHLGELSDQIEKLGNVDTSIPGNNAVNWVKNQSNASSAAGAPLAAFNAIVSKYVEEATKFYRGTGGTEADISRDMLNISPNMSPTQLKAAIGAQIPLIAGKIAAMQDRWHQGMGPHAGDYQILSPQAQAVLDRLAPQSAAGPATQPLPTAGPAAKSGALDQARAAIARGASRDAVIQRLQRMGIDVSGSGL